MILIDALFIANEGGGPNLLRYLIDVIRSNGKESEFFLYLDERFQHDVSGFAHLRSKAGLLKRLNFYRQNRERFSRVLCFANTPPPVRLNVPVHTYFHNQMLLESRRRFASKQYFRFLLRYAFVALWNNNTDDYIVQTPHMVEEIVSAGLKPETRCKQFPIFKPFERAYVADYRSLTEFVYVSAASFYKNHTTLLNAWEHLFDRGLNPVLHLTVTDTYTSVLLHIKRLQDKGVQIINHGYIDTSELYGRCAYMIYPSLNESFGLSLIEGANAGMKILAADLPYVRSVIEASVYFDPLDVGAISQAVAAVLQNAPSLTKIVVEDRVDELLEYILN
ncbi:glycosyltransferase [Polluticoccus soli]|uniref:glycosyltransferase n=1 Tax=Polluticoccus soli TaxID=3034150 RepID=UPI0023E1EB4C|nr:glycosyltransferase [Flavipsychrobacter sp. JY13-12]